MIELTLVGLGALILLVMWAVILPNWRRGIEHFIVFISFSGAVEQLLYPASWPVLHIKEIVFAISAHIGFAMSGELARAWFGLLRSVVLVLFLFVGIVLVKALNPAGPGPVATLIGLKVWLFCLPMLVLVPAGSILALNSVLEEGLRGFGNPYTVLCAELTGLMTTAVALTLTLRPLGIMGGGVSSLVGYSTVFVSLLINDQRLIGVSPGALLWPRAGELQIGLRRVESLVRALVAPAE